VGATEFAGSPQLDKDAGEIAGVGSIGVPITAQLSPLLKGQVVVIEFSTPAATLEHVKLAAEKRFPSSSAPPDPTKNSWMKLKALAPNADTSLCQHEPGSEPPGQSSGQSRQDPRG
jgi:4-hydroxy-tetrahydrodipicolinate reductase